MVINAGILVSLSLNNPHLSSKVVKGDRPISSQKRTQKAEVATVARGAGLAGKDLRFQGRSRGEHGNLVGGVTVNIDGCSMFFNHTWDDWLR